MIRSKKARSMQALAVGVGRQPLATHTGASGEPHLEVLDVVASDVGHGRDLGVTDQPQAQLAQRVVGDVDAARRQERGQLGQVAAHCGRHCRR
jgi:hypothetical protein